ncbi:nickel ABC transporter, nickel/metallophore periplasmic binding protein [Enterococcus sp. 10A9_DIV0425]|uniref:Nickel ABC transporter, nickel/metallophore periplasmic binding protein n=1 Tax=Candidatus Enterococcus wittei TaxID=1987383 RepID=A0A242K0G7_9ENTE|nr:nickel ABC transporter substrate-binding protein [Enterococcus sp. 10A9_DIV0425]OTP11151.1 nickel ABC transporter, nickel/metallophore periplasmic binding protein [Enterococcus sp. 10A9_DIV0425]THE13540.1 nickel ABC transporter, nickel/metallophore periplasmic binding protein [Enterococcus hirae]
MKFRRNISYIMILLGCSFLLAACTSNQQEVKETELNYGSTKDIRDINPHIYSGEMAAQNMVFEGLTKNEDGQVKPALAQSWDISPDGRVYTFKLRKNVKFSDGEAFNAQVVKMNMDAIMANKSRHAWLELVDEIADTKAIDPDTFQLTLKEPYYPTLTELGLTRPFRFISPNCFIDGGTKDGVKEYIGTGPWVLKEHTRDQKAVFVRNENYWGEKPAIETINWKVISDPQTLVLSLKNGDVDLIYGSDGDQLSMDTFNRLKTDASFATYVSNPIASRAVLLNSKRPYLNDVRVREAIEYAVNKKEIVEGILDGTEKEADTLLSKNVPYCDVDLTNYYYNPPKAKQLLEEAGWKLTDQGTREKAGETMELVFSYNSQNEQEGTIAQAIQEDLKDIGISVKILPEEKQLFLDRQKDGDFDLQYSLSWGTPYDPQSYLSSWRIPAHGDYQAQLGLAKKQWLDEKISETLVETDEDKRKEDYQEILTYINNQCVYLPLSYSRTKAVASSAVKGVTFNDSQYEIPFEKMSK